MRIRPVLLLPILSLFALAGCQTGDVKTVLPLAGGGKVAIQLTLHGPVPGEADGYQGGAATVVPTKENRTLQYGFGLHAMRKPELSRIQIVDMSDDEPEPLIDDTHPAFDANGNWFVKSESIPADDPRVKWMYTLPLAFRVYRYTLTHNDGKQSMFYHVGVYPQFLKAAIRSAWGEKY